jgi:hypothetical protein
MMFGQNQMNQGSSNNPPGTQTQRVSIPKHVSMLEDTNRGWVLQKSIFTNLALNLFCHKVDFTEGNKPRQI